MRPAAIIGSGLQKTAPESHSSIAAVGLAFGFSAAFRAIELADRVSANFDHTCFAPSRSYSRKRTAPWTITYEPFVSVPGEFCLLPERNNSVPVCAALPIADGVLPGLFGRD